MGVPAGTVVQLWLECVRGSALTVVVSQTVKPGRDERGPVEGA